MYPFPCHHLSTCLFIKLPCPSLRSSLSQQYCHCGSHQPCLCVCLCVSAVQYVLRKACLSPEDPSRFAVTIGGINTALDRLAAAEDKKEQVRGRCHVPKPIYRAGCGDD